MKGFVQGADRQQTTLLPECLDDWVDESNPVRAVDVFVDALDLAEMSFEGLSQQQLAVVPPLGSPQALHLRLSEPGAVEPAAGAGVPAQHLAGLADRPPDAGLQDHSRLPQGQW